MQWWNDFLGWFDTTDGQTVLFSAIIPFAAILVAGIVAAAIGRGSTKRLLTLNDRENRVAAVATMIGGARRASVWNTLSAPEQQHADHVASEADVRVRLLAVPGSGLAADWAAHEIAAMKRNSVSFSFQAEQSLIEFRDRMVQWQAKPARAKKLFKNDLDLWSYEDSQATKDIITQQQAWAASQVATETGSVATQQQAWAASQVATETGSVATQQPASASSTSTARATADPDGAGAGASTFAPRSAPSVSISDLASPTSETPDSAHAPDLVEPRAQDDDALEDDSERRLDDAVYSPPVGVGSVTKRINPPKVGDDGKKY